MSFVAFAQTFLGTSKAIRALEALDPNAQQNLGNVNPQNSAETLPVVNGIPWPYLG